MARILVIEDEPLVGHMLRRFLERAGHEVVWAPNGEVGLRRLAEGFDLALRANHQGPQNLVARRIATYRRGVYATPAYVGRYGTPRHPDDLEQFSAVVHLEAGHLNRWRFVVDGQLRTCSPPARALSANSTWLVAEMVLTDLGLGWLSTVIAEPLVQSGRLVEVLGEFHDPSTFDIHAMMLPERDRLPRIRAVVEFLSEALSSIRAHQDAPPVRTL